MENITSGDTQLLDKGCGTYCGLSFLRWPLVLWETAIQLPTVQQGFLPSVQGMAQSR